MRNIKICFYLFVLILIILQLPCFATWQPIGYSRVYTTPPPSMDSIRYDMQRYDQMQQQQEYQRQMYDMQQRQLREMQFQNQQRFYNTPQINLNGYR